MKLRVSVKTDCKSSKILGLVDNMLKVELKSPPLKNKANKELVKLLKKHYGRPVSINSGLSTHIKTIIVED